MLIETIEEREKSRIRRQRRRERREERRRHNQEENNPRRDRQFIREEQQPSYDIELADARIVDSDQPLHQ